MEKIKANLPTERVEDIQSEMTDDWNKWKTSCAKIWENGCNSEQEKIDYSKPSWSTFATTNPIGDKLGVRGCVAFHKIPCVFKKQTNGEGCTHCALSLDDKSLKEVSQKDQITSVKTAILKITEQLGFTPSTLEILPDGSFLNEDEISIEAQNGIFDLIAQNDGITQIAIESRTKYISIEKIRHLLSLLRENQILEIYVGLESIDDFVLNKIIKKGFTVEEYETLIQELAANLTEKEKKRLHLSVYHFFKPPYLTEKESIDASIAMAEKVKEYKIQTGIEFSVKYEPAIISDGTFQRYLFDQEKFSPPNYFSVAETVASSYFYDFVNLIKFGQRDDIDNFQTVAGVPNLENAHMFSPFDFIVYNAVQRFNADQDIWGFCADLSIAFKNAPEFKKWEQEVYGEAGKSFLSQLFAEYKTQDFGEKHKERIDFQKRVWKNLDLLEYENNGLSDENRQKGKEGASSVEAKIISIFLQNDIKVLQIKNIKFYDVGKISNAKKITNCHSDFTNATEKAVYQCEIVIENEAGLPQSLWGKIPLQPIEVDLETFSFIYESKE